MNLFQLLCINGCGNKPNIFLRIINKIFTYGRFSVLAIALLLILVHLIKWIITNKKDRYSGDILLKKIIKIFLGAIVIFVVLTLIQTLLGIIFPISEYDSNLHCWCA